MKAVLTLPEAQRVLNKATLYLSYRSKALVEKLTLTPEKMCIIRECLQDCEPGSSFTLEKMLSLTEREREIAYNAINHVLQTQALQIAFANEHDDEGAAYPMLYLNIALEDLLAK